MVKKNEVGEVRKAIRRIYPYKNNFNTYKNKISKNFGSKFTPKINKWNKKIQKKTKNKVTISSPFAKQKGGFFPSKKQLDSINPWMLRKMNKIHNGYKGYKGQFAKRKQKGESKIGWDGAPKFIDEATKHKILLQDPQYRKEIWKIKRAKMWQKAGMKVPKQKGGMYRPRKKRENKIPSMEYRYEY